MWLKYYSGKSNLTFLICATCVARGAWPLKYDLMTNHTPPPPPPLMFFYIYLAILLNLLRFSKSTLSIYASPRSI